MHDGEKAEIPGRASAVTGKAAGEGGQRLGNVRSADPHSPDAADTVIVCSGSEIRLLRFGL